MFSAHFIYVFFTVDIDCEVSKWSDWTEPFAFGDRTRSRYITVDKVNNGDDCPHLIEVNKTGESNIISWTNVKTFYNKAAVTIQAILIIK